MKYYHVTKRENINNIKENGLVVSNQEESEYTTNDSETFIGQSINCVFLFVDTYEAYSFICDNNSDDDKIIVEFDAEIETILDPEYNGEAVICESTINVSDINIYEIDEFEY